MPSKKGIDQALTWLKGKACDKNTLDGINAELCINVIMDLQRQYDRLGSQFNNIKNSRYTDKAAVMEEEQMSFLEKATVIKNPEKQYKPVLKVETQNATPRTKNIPLNRKGDVTNEETRTETTGVYCGKSDS